MTKSRTLLLAFAPLAVAWPGAALAEPRTATAEEVLTAYEEDFRAVMGSAAGRACPAGEGDEEIVVCGRDDSASYRVSYEPPAGERARLIAGEAPSAVEALGVGGACCGGAQGINVIALINTLGRGLDRILHPD